jgi:subtilisin family serine protease
MKQNHIALRNLLKSAICLLLILPFGMNSFAQPQYFGPADFKDMPPDSVVRIDHRTSQMMYEPGEVLVRFKDDVSINIFKSNGKAQTGLMAIDAIFDKFNVFDAGQLIPGAQPLKSKEILRTFTGKEFERPSLHNIYLLKTEQESYEIFELIEALKEDENVMYAEPNYIYSLVGHEAIGPVLTADDLKEMNGNNQNKSSKDVITPNDPFYDQQWWIQAINADQAWVQSTGDTNQVIAILDTGVDWQHPDLQNKIWNNPNETLNGQDSDGNGFVDDIRGWDFINHRNNPMDDNSHGTHVAGIAAAEADNGIGIAGVSWGAKIMPVKVLQSSGFGNAATIMQGINYAVNNGATVINMSFGSYSRSLAMENALANAYASAVLVAAAGNDGVCIGPGMFCAPMFPAAFSFVLGIEASNQSGQRAGFSNYDQDGPVYSAYPELWNYELMAPGSQLISTIPGGNYRIYSGTSMATPLVAGSAAIYRSLFPEKSQEIMWSDMINTSSNVFDLQAVLNGFSEAMLGFVSHVIVDTLDGDGDGRPDAGETIEIWFTVRNTGTQADSVTIGISLGEFEDPDVAEIINSHSYIGSISSYAIRTNELYPLVIKIDSNVVHDRHIMFQVWQTNYPFQDSVWQSLMLTIENGEELKDVLTGTKVLTPNKLYLVNQSFMVGSSGTLIIKPGVKILFYPEKTIPVSGNLVAQGTPDSLIVFMGYNPAGSNQPVGPIFSFRNNDNPNHTKFSYCHFENLLSALHCEFNAGLAPYYFIRMPSVHNSVFTEVYSIGIADTLINNYFISPPFGPLYSGIKESFYYPGHIELNNFIGPPTSNKFFYNGELPYLFRHFNDRFRVLKNNNFINYRNSPSYEPNAGKILDPSHRNNWISEYSKSGIVYTKVNTYSWSAAEFHPFKHQYWGTSDSIKIEGMFYDFLDNPMLPRADYHPFLNSPNEDCHAVVWKVLVNGADAQDEYVEPVGVGPQRFDVYFNRPMDIEYTTNLTFGVRYPYTQQAVNDSASWSADSTIYTTWKTVKIYTGDGINRIRVAGARDTDGFEIPIEDMRFEFLIDAAGSASTDFMATPGLGIVNLEWSHPEGIEDLLGYNMYRFQHITDTTFTQPVLINETLVLDTLFTDYNVVPGIKYYYYYKILRTNLAETDSSRIVNCIPHTAAPGDANGDYNVDVLDIISIVAYMLNQNPQPFIFEAADVNGDGIINVLDIIGVVQLINGDTKSISHIISQNPDPAYLYMEDNLIQLNSKGQVAALQFELLTDKPELIELSALLPGFEFAWARTENSIPGIIFSMQGKPIPTGLVDLVRINDHNQGLQWGETLGGDLQGRYVKLITTGEQPYIPPAYSLQAYPNPTRNQLNISYDIPVVSEVQVVLYDLYGRQLSVIADARLTEGNYIHRLDLESLGINSGMVLCHIRAQGKDGTYYSKSLKVMIIKQH